MMAGIEDAPLNPSEPDVAGDSSEEDRETMTERQKELLTEHHAVLAEGMNPTKVVGHLQRKGVLDLYDKESILAATTTQDKNDRLIEVLKRRSREAFPAFADVLRTIDPKHAALAEKLLPIRYRVLWFAASASQAAAVVYVLEKYANTLFSNVKTGVGCLFRCGRALDAFDGMSCLEIWLVFPLDEKPDLVAEAMAAAFKTVCPQADMALMSGVCKGVGEGVRSGDLVVANAVAQLNSAYPIGPTQNHMEDLERHLRDLIAPSWLEEVKRDLLIESSKEYQTLWLTRLYLELQKVENGQRPQWLATDSLVDWDICQSLKCEKNQAILAKNLPNWKDGTLATFLLEERALWQSDHSSPLGMSPHRHLLTTVKKRLVAQADYPAPHRTPRLAPPHFGMMATELPTSREGGTQLPSPLVYDDHCFQFYSLSLSELGRDKPWFVCKAVSYELGGSQTLSVISSTCLLTEAVKVFAGLQREAEGL